MRMLDGTKELLRCSIAEAMAMSKDDEAQQLLLLLRAGVVPDGIDTPVGQPPLEVAQVELPLLETQPAIAAPRDVYSWANIVRRQYLPRLLVEGRVSFSSEALCFWVQDNIPLSEGDMEPCSKGPRWRVRVSDALLMLRQDGVIELQKPKSHVYKLLAEVGPQAP